MLVSEMVSPFINFPIMEMNSNEWNCQHCTLINEHNEKCCQKMHASSSSTSSFNDQSPIPNTLTSLSSLPLQTQHICQSCYKTSEVVCFKSMKDVTTNSNQSENYKSVEIDIQQSRTNSSLNVTSEGRRENVKKLNALRFHSLMEVISKRIGTSSESEILYLKSQLNLPLAPDIVVERWLGTVEKFILFEGRQEILDKRSREMMKQSLIENDGDITLAHDHFTKAWKNKLDQLKSNCFIPNLSDLEYNTTLTECLGNIHDATTALIKQKLSYAVWSVGRRRLEDLYAKGEREVSLDADLVKVLRSDGVDDEPSGMNSDNFKRRVRMMLAESDIVPVRNETEARRVLELMHLVTEAYNKNNNEKKDYDDDTFNRIQPRLKLGRQLDILDCLEASRNTPNLSEAVITLLDTCALCYYEFPRKQFVEFIDCKCVFCKCCFSDHFKQKITTNQIHKLHCPSCIKPTINNQFNCSEYFRKLEVMLKSLIEQEVVVNFQQRLVEWSLKNGKNEKIVYCRWCNLMIIASQDIKFDVTCLYCHRRFCLNCEWKGLTSHNCGKNQEPLKISNLIECPDCHESYDLVKGGCLHLSCYNCQVEFCKDCKQRFSNSNKYGLYCYHERSCISNLRAYGVSLLQDLLKNNGIPYQTSSSSSLTCPVLVQLEVDTAVIPCSKPTLDFAGYCEDHYVEFLASLINKHQLDSVCIMDKRSMVLFLERFSLNNDDMNNNGNNNPTRTRTKSDNYNENDNINEREKLDSSGPAPSQARASVSSIGETFSWSESCDIDDLRQLIKKHFPISWKNP